MTGTSIGLRAQQLNAGFFNDSQNGAIGPNQDDYRSFGFDAQYWHRDKLSISAVYSGLTYRSRKDTTSGGRLDELFLLGKLEAFKYKNVHFYPVLGIALTGNLGGETIQNDIHASVDEPLVFLDYDYQQEIHAALGVSAIHRKEWSPENKWPFYWESELTYIYTNGYSNHLRVGTGIFLGRRWEDRIGITAAYQFQGIFGSETGSAVGDQETGLRIGLQEDVSFHTWSWEIYLPSNFSSGRFGINLLKLNCKREFKKEDVAVDFALLLDAAGIMNRYKWKFASIGQLPLRISMNHTFGTFTKEVIPVHPDVRSQYLQVDAGAELSWREVKPKFQINPFVAIGGGVRDDMTFAGEDPDVPNLHSVAPVVYADAGIRIGGPLSFLPRNTIVAFQFGSKYTLPFYTETQYLKGQPVEFLQPRNDLYIGFSFSTDL